jgi:translation initiation factor 3 subunit E
MNASVQCEAKIMESMYKLAKYRYECGNYSLTTSYLYFYILVMPTSDKVTSALFSS